jgi:hypothetical protein
LARLIIKAANNNNKIDKKPLSFICDFEQDHFHQWCCPRENGFGKLP